MSGGRYAPGKHPERHCLKVEVWPEPDKAIWQRACIPTSILADEGGELTALAPVSQRKTAKGWGRLLSHFKVHEPSCLLLPPAERVTRQRIVAYVCRLEELKNSTRTVLCRLQELSDALKVLAPACSFPFINRIASHVRACHRPARVKHNKIMADEVAELAFNLMQSVDGLGASAAALQYRDGLILLLLTHLPLRRKNFANLTIGQSLVQRQGQWFVTLTPQETKTHAFFEAVLHPDLVPYLEVYLNDHRPVLMALDGRWNAPPGDRLWISKHGSAMTEIAIYDRVTARTEAAFGFALSPHRFRDMLASTIASHAPEHIHAAAPLLGHASLRTTEKYYRIARAQEGHKRYVKTLRTIREKANG